MKKLWGSRESWRKHLHEQPKRKKRAEKYKKGSVAVCGAVDQETISDISTRVHVQEGGVHMQEAGKAFF